MQHPYAPGRDDASEGLHQAAAFREAQSQAWQMTLMRVRECDMAMRGGVVLDEMQREYAALGQDRALAEAAARYGITPAGAERINASQPESQ